MMKTFYNRYGECAVITGAFDLVSRPALHNKFEDQPTIRSPPKASRS